MGTSRLELLHSDSLHMAVERYERVRPGTGLTRIEVELLKDRVRISWPDLPQRVAVESWTPSLAQRALRWLVALEHAWGEPLGTSLDLESLRFDPARQQFAVGPAIFQPADPADLLFHLAAVLSIAPQTVAGMRGFVQLALRAGLQDLHLDESTRVRMFVQAGRRALGVGEMVPAFEDALRAWELRPGDVDAGCLLLEAVSRRPKLVRDARVARVAESLMGHRAPSADLQFWLARFCLATGDAPGALSWARASADRAPESRRTWKVVAAAASKMGDRGLVREGLRNAAKLGDDGALKQLVRCSSSDEWGPVAQGWTGELNSLVLGLRLRSLVGEHRFKRALRDALHRPDLIGGLDRAALDALMRAAVGVPGGSFGLREALRPLCDADASADVIQCYGRLCLNDQQPDIVVDLAARHPAALDAGMVIRAHADAERWDDVLCLTADLPAFARDRLHALQALATGRGRRVSSGEVRACLAALEESGDLCAAGALEGRLRDTLADHPFTRVLRDELRHLQRRS